MSKHIKGQNDIGKVNKPLKKSDKNRVKTENCPEKPFTIVKESHWYAIKLSDLIQVAIASVMLVSVICANKSINIQEDALKKMTDLYAAQLRPFVFSQALDRPINLKQDGTFSVWYNMKNCGETPAFNLTTASKLTESINFPDLSFELSESDRELTGCTDCATALYPTDERAFQSKDFQLSVANMDEPIPVTLDLVDQHSPYFMHIEIRYMDQFGIEYVNKSTYMSIDLSDDGIMSWSRISVEPDI